MTYNCNKIQILSHTPFHTCSKTRSHRRTREWIRGCDEMPTSLDILRKRYFFPRKRYIMQFLICSRIVCIPTELWIYLVELSIRHQVTAVNGGTESMKQTKVKSVPRMPVKMELLYVTTGRSKILKHYTQKRAVSGSNWSAGQLMDGWT